MVWDLSTVDSANEDITQYRWGAKTINYTVHINIQDRKKKKSEMK